VSARKQPTGGTTATTSYTQKLNQLIEWVQQLESGSLGFEESLVRFEAAMKLSAELQQYLQTAEQRVTKALRSTQGLVTEE
jgi:exodeoxyribonuclease VII small subunit